MPRANAVNSVGRPELECLLLADSAHRRTSASSRASGVGERSLALDQAGTKAWVGALDETVVERHCYACSRFVVRRASASRQIRRLVSVSLAILRERCHLSVWCAKLGAEHVRSRAERAVRSWNGSRGAKLASVADSGQDDRSGLPIRQWMNVCGFLGAAGRSPDKRSSAWSLSTI